MRSLSLLTLLASGPTLALAGVSSAQTPLTTELFVDGLSVPTDLKPVPGQPERFLVAEKSGLVRLIEAGQLQAAPYLDLTGQVVETINEQGLLSVALHPQFPSNGRFFVNYTGVGNATFIEEYAAVPGSATANPARQQTIAIIPQDANTHNGACMHFGPDGMLYVSTGDGRFNNPIDRSQQLDSRLGKILRYDVDGQDPFIPLDNPFLSTPGADPAILHIGLRNPWRFSFDRATGDMWIGDVGQVSLEEVNFVPAGAQGLNFGWSCKEGTSCYSPTGSCDCADPFLTDPVAEFAHVGGRCSTTGGYRYRGAAIPDLVGRYIYGDLCTGAIYSLAFDGVMVTDLVERTSELRTPTGARIQPLVSFGEDLAGELYVMNLLGEIYKIVPDQPFCPQTLYCSAAPNQSGQGAWIRASGSSSVTENNLVLGAGGMAPGTTGLFVYGAGRQVQPAGAGILCIAAPIVRTLPVVAADAAGLVRLPVDLGEFPFSTGGGAIAPGSSWNFQLWYRDVQAGGPSFNFSYGTSVLFCP